MPKKQKRKTGTHFRQAAAAAAGATNNASAGPSGKASNSKANPPTPKSALILAIDFGTTFSGIAWHHTASGKPHILRDWPKQTQSSNKVPTVLRYSKQGVQWGHVRSTRNRLEWFKLLLNEKEYNTTDELLRRLERKGLNGYGESASTNLAQLRTTIKAMALAEKKPAELAADYLKELYEYAKETLGQNFPTLKEDLGREGGVEIKCCLTVPAIWDDKAKELTKRAAIKAGITENEIYMISEPEAAAVHALTDLEGVKGNLKIGDVYVIVDCGGGTVDLISYKVTSIKPLRVIECNVGSGGLYGSTILNRRFEDLVIRRIGQKSYDQMDEEDRMQMRSYFDTEIKPRFVPDDEDDDDEDGWVCPLPGVSPADDRTKGIRKGRITFSTTEMKEIFEPTFMEITKLVQDQITAAHQATEKNVDAIILVGGFGSSNYLAQWLQKSVRNRDGKEVRFIRPLDPSIAIVLGAVEHGVQQHRAGKASSWGIVESRKARYHYGISLSEKFIPYIHPFHKRYMDPILGVIMCSGRMSWIIKKGENMRQGVGIRQQFFGRCRIVDSEDEQNQLLVFEQDVYASAAPADAAPDDEEHPSVHKLLTYKFDLKDVPKTKFSRTLSMTGRSYWLIKASIWVKLESADLTFTTVVAGKPCGKGTKLYHHKELGQEQLDSTSPTRELQGWAYTDPSHERIQPLENNTEDGGDGEIDEDGKNGEDSEDGEDDEDGEDREDGEDDGLEEELDLLNHS